MTNQSNLLLDNYNEDISLGISNNNRNKFKLADTTNNYNENSKSMDIDQ